MKKILSNDINLLFAFFWRRIKEAGRMPTYYFLIEEIVEVWVSVGRCDWTDSNWLYIHLIDLVTRTKWKMSLEFGVGVRGSCHWTDSICLYIHLIDLVTRTKWNRSLRFGVGVRGRCHWTDSIWLYIHLIDLVTRTKRNRSLGFGVGVFRSKASKSSTLLFHLEQK